MTNSFTADFELTDAAIASAVRQQLIAHARKGVGKWDLVIVPLNLVVFLAVVYYQLHWIWWATGIPLLMLLVQGATFAGAYFWLPSSGAAKLRHLPHRKVRVEVADETVSMETANEKLQVKWVEVKALDRLPDYWLIQLRSGSVIPVPLAAVSEGMAAELRRRRDKHRDRG